MPECSLNLVFSNFVGQVVACSSLPHVNLTITPDRSLIRLSIDRKCGLYIVAYCVNIGVNVSTLEVLCFAIRLRLNAT